MKNEIWQIRPVSAAIFKAENDRMVTSIQSYIQGAGI